MADKDNRALSPAEYREFGQLAMAIIRKYESTFVYSPESGAYSIYFVRMPGTTIVNDAIATPGPLEIEGPVGATRSAELQAEYSTLVARLESPVRGAVYIVFAVEINGSWIENTAALRNTLECRRRPRVG